MFVSGFISLKLINLKHLSVITHIIITQIPTILTNALSLFFTRVGSNLEVKTLSFSREVDNQSQLSTLTKLHNQYQWKLRYQFFTRVGSKLEVKTLSSSREVDNLSQLSTLTGLHNQYWQNLLNLTKQIKECKIMMHIIGKFNFLVI